ncbi:MULTISPECIES: hypothetical protein [unclassified Pseudomonas]|uniref:hypothetical protein n=1 Tax=unclassified Pseudomonas TaxID=196821 RepID=UPI000A1DFED0|nr:MULTISPECIES: hypothetical protein [unclassified Pseudomonas]
MFWNKENRIKVELISPVSLTLPQARDCPAPTETVLPVDQPKVNTELAFKLLIYGAVVSQTALLIIGYSLLVGYYEQFGIDTNELTLGTPTLLLYGYVNILSGALSVTHRLPLLGTGLLATAYICISALFLLLITKRLKEGVIIGLSSWIGFSLLLISFAPGIGVQTGAERGLKDFAEYTHQEVPKGLDDIHTVITDKGERLTGHLILSDSKSTFLLIGTKVLKIDGIKGRVIRETELRVEEPASKKPD